MFFGISNHEECRTIFDTASRILEFGFPKDVTAGFFGETIEFYERSVADC